MSDTIAILSVTLKIIWWPISRIPYAIGLTGYAISCIIHPIGVILAPFWAILHFLLLPLIYLVQGILTIVLFPLRAEIPESIKVCQCQSSYVCFSIIDAGPKSPLHAIVTLFEKLVLC
jgi:hypothetical protein